jgi:DNA-binding IclR family transcriptional regulator
LASAIQKTFKCIEALARSPSGLTVSEVANVAGFSRPAATRLLEGLMADAIILRDAKTKRYRLSLRLYEWANTAVQAAMPINIARKEFIKLSMEIRRECNFTVLEDTDAVLLERAEDIDGVPLNRPVTGRRPWYQTASGRAIVGFSEASLTRAVFDHTARLKNAPAFDAAQLTADLELVRRQGYATITGMRPEGVISLAVPLLGQSGYAVAAVGTFIRATELETDVGAEIISQLKSAASRVSHYLGYETETAALVG